MRLVRQISPTTSGQACVAMVLGCLIGDAISIVGHSNEMDEGEMERIFKKNFLPGPPPHNSTYIFKDGGKWFLTYKGSPLNYSEDHRILSYLPVSPEEENF